MAGKQLWQVAAKPGRPRKFETADDLWKHFVSYVKFVDDNPWTSIDVKVVDKSVEKIEVDKRIPYSLGGFCVYMGIGDGFFNQYDKQKSTPEGFSVVIFAIRKTIETQQLEGASAGFFNANIISRVLHLVDKQETTSKVIVVEQPEEEGENEVQ